MRLADVFYNFNNRDINVGLFFEQQVSDSAGMQLHCRNTWYRLIQRPCKIYDARQQKLRQYKLMMKVLNGTKDYLPHV
jgi:hypothetical protein